jgi:hypothetical protein
MKTEDFLSKYSPARRVHFSPKAISLSWSPYLSSFLSVPQSFISQIPRCAAERERERDIERERERERERKRERENLCMLFWHIF